MFLSIFSEETIHLKHVFIKLEYMFIPSVQQLLVTTLSTELWRWPVHPLSYSSPFLQSSEQKFELCWYQDLCSFACVHWLRSSDLTCQYTLPSDVRQQRIADKFLVRANLCRVKTNPSISIFIWTANCCNLHKPM